jgi:hypothetical protein
MAEVVGVEGLADLRRALARVSPEARRGLTAGIKLLAAQIAERAKANARAQGLDKTGNLIKGIKPACVGTTGMIRETAVSYTEVGSRRIKRSYSGRDSSRHTYSGGYPYPAIYEYGHKQSYWNRPFVNPAVDASHELIISELGRYISEALNEAFHPL